MELNIFHMGCFLYRNSKFAFFPMITLNQFWALQKTVLLAPFFFRSHTSYFWCGLSHIQHPDTCSTLRQSRSRFWGILEACPMGTSDALSWPDCVQSLSSTLSCKPHIGCFWAWVEHKWCLLEWVPQLNSVLVNLNSVALKGMKEIQSEPHWTQIFSDQTQ